MNEKGPTFAEKELLAALVDEPAYKILMDYLQMWVDDLTDVLSSQNCKDEQQILPYWRALKKIYTELKLYPQNILEEVRVTREELGEQVDSHTQMRKLVMEEILKKQREQRASVDKL